MKERYARYNTDYSWLIKEEGWVKVLQSVRESQLALGNGVLGARAILEEIPYDAKPGTFLAGLYDKIGSQVSELVNLPNPFNFKITTDGEKLGLGAMDALQHKRTLNLKNGLLCRHTIFQDVKKRKYDYQSLRFVSMDDKNIGVMQIAFTPLSGGIKATIETGIDTAVYNAGTVTEGRKRHFRVKELSQFDKEGCLLLETFGKLHYVIFKGGFYYETGGKKVMAEDNVFELKLRKNQTVVFTKIFYVEAVPKDDDLDRAKKSSEKAFRKAYRSSFNTLINRHIQAWDNLWNIAEVCLWGDPELEKNIRFNIYHMLICAPQDNGNSSVGAKALTGEGYRGHIFWDSEIFLFPFYLYILPHSAKNMLLYRYKRLDEAREIAKKFGFKGAMFPWESAGLGVDETPGYAKDLDGKVIRIHTGKMEHHITADIAYAFYHYYNATRDEKFFDDCGYEVMFETARFWASRVEYNKKRNKYEIKHVVGPDEFHNDIDNNAYTNMMAKWNLLTADKLFQKIKKTKPKVFRAVTYKVSLSAKEAKEWKKIASRISINLSNDHILEQFDGYFKKRYVKVGNWDENNLPTISSKLSPRGYGKTQLIKQADVMMLLYLLSDVFNFRTKKKNYEYYIERTLHRSSLSFPIYSIIGTEVGDKGMAYRFFISALNTDIANIHNNTYDGVHAACMGGTWQALINGFAGTRIEKGILSVNPQLPRTWRKVVFPLQWRGNLLKLEVKNDKVKIQITSTGGKKVKLKIFGALHELSGSKIFSVEKKRPSRKTEACYL